MNTDIHAHTPRLSVIDSRGLAVRDVAYWRRNADSHPLQTLVTARQYDIIGHSVAQRDPRFLAPTSRPNLSEVHSLSARVLLSDSLDAGWSLGLQDETGQQHERWDGRGNHWQHEYDELRRPVATHEQTPDSNRRTVERLTYADSSAEFAERNQCGQMIRQDDRAGCLWLDQQALSGGLMQQTRRFLPEQVEVLADWPADETDRDFLLKPGEGYASQGHYGPLGEVLVQTDAAGHRQQFIVDRAGQLQRIDLTLKSLSPQPLLKAAHYNAEGQLLTQITGNNVTSSATYEASTGRLKRLTATTSEGVRLQDLRHDYDPVGNILRLQDHAQPITFFANQRVAAENTYAYDSLYQLVCATGRETVDAGQHPGLPELIIPSPIDPGRLLNYTEYYQYDEGGNRTELRHASDNNPFRQLMRADPHSNRALAWNEGDDEPDFPRCFDANGNLKRLVPGAQPMEWDALNQLHSVITVRRSPGADDSEGYRYSAAGERVVKFSSQQAHAITHQRVVHYLPGLEVRTVDNDEEFQVICVPLPRGSVRCLHWVKGKPGDIENAQLRYSVDDHLGSCSLELDKRAAVISHEGYYPFGGTAWWAARSKVDADYKTVRYSGKERDACGLYYYGFRYYAPWLGRWVNPDPAGDIDGLNRYLMVGNNAITYKDFLGQNKTPINKDIYLVWAGENPDKLKAHTQNINNTVTQADGYKVHLYLDTYNPDAFSETLKDLKIHDVIYWQGSDLSSRFSSTPAARIYDDFRNYHEKNLAFAVDVTRVYIVNALGGMYSDVDDIYHSEDTSEHVRLRGTLLEAEPDQVLTLHPTMPSWTTSLQINNSSFAAHANNALLTAALDEMVVRFDRTVKSIGRLDPMGLGATTLFQPNLNRDLLLTSIVGPGVLTDVITQNDSVMNVLVSHFNDFQTGKVTTTSPELIELINERMPLSRHIEIGSLNSW
ncbi:RHS repeat-associated core domain-containing protein [Pseudomonas migulae]|uniref:RHS repeat-associated core domain-containing protein n=1 Tax=Pseudomonas migulae TaxID=78543 RepID=UPI0037239B5B